jgi:hypothetical protein
MSDKAYNRKGQSIFEYFILTIIVVSIALYFMNNSTFVRVKTAGSDFFNGAVANITKQ